MSDSLFFKLGRGSLQTAREILGKLAKDLGLGEICIYLDEDSLDDLMVALNELEILADIKFLKGETDIPATIHIDFLKAYIKSKRKLIISDKEVEKYLKDVEAL